MDFPVFLAGSICCLILCFLPVHPVTSQLTDYVNLYRPLDEMNIFCTMSVDESAINPVYKIMDSEAIRALLEFQPKNRFAVDYIGLTKDGTLSVILRIQSVSADFIRFTRVGVPIYTNLLHQPRRYQVYMHIYIKAYNENFRKEHLKVTLFAHLSKAENGTNTISVSVAQEFPVNNVVLTITKIPKSSDQIVVLAPRGTGELHCRLPSDNDNSTSFPYRGSPCDASTAKAPPKTTGLDKTPPPTELTPNGTPTSPSANPNSNNPATAIIPPKKPNEEWDKIINDLGKDPKKSPNPPNRPIAETGTGGTQLAKMESVKSELSSTTNAKNTTENLDIDPAKKSHRKKSNSLTNIPSTPSNEKQTSKQRPASSLDLSSNSVSQKRETPTTGEQSKPKTSFRQLFFGKKADVEKEEPSIKNKKIIDQQEREDRKTLELKRNEGEENSRLNKHDIKLPRVKPEDVNSKDKSSSSLNQSNCEEICIHAYTTSSSFKTYPVREILDNGIVKYRLKDEDEETIEVLRKLTCSKTKSMTYRLSHRKLIIQGFACSFYNGLPEFIQMIGPYVLHKIGTRSECTGFPTNVQVQFRVGEQGERMYVLGLREDDYVPDKMTYAIRFSGTEISYVEYVTIGLITRVSYMVNPKITREITFQPTGTTAKGLTGEEKAIHVYLLTIEAPDFRGTLIVTQHISGEKIYQLVDDKETTKEIWLAINENANNYTYILSPCLYAPFHPGKILQPLIKAGHLPYQIMVEQKLFTPV